jgi:hypothetical protein
MKKLTAECAAFPIFTHDGVPISRGLTKREWFAGMALTGLCAESDNWETTDVVNGKVINLTVSEIQARLGQRAVEIADATLAALEQEDKTNE